MRSSHPVVIVFTSCRVVVPPVVKNSYWHCNLVPLHSKTFIKKARRSELSILIFKLTYFA